MSKKMNEEIRKNTEAVKMLSNYLQGITPIDVIKAKMSSEKNCFSEESDGIDDLNMQAAAMQAEESDQLEIIKKTYRIMQAQNSQIQQLQMDIKLLRKNFKALNSDQKTIKRDVNEELHILSRRVDELEAYAEIINKKVKKLRMKIIDICRVALPKYSIQSLKEVKKAVKKSIKNMKG